MRLHADRIALAAARRVSVDQEAKLGEQAFAGMRAALDLEDSGPALDAVRALGIRLMQGSQYDYCWYVSKNAQINAFALPGGIIVVNSGLINATRRPEQLAGVLAHEIQHVEQRHSLQAVIKDLGLRSLWILATGDAGGSLMGRAALELTALTFSRDAELQADARAFDTLVGNGVDPDGLTEFFRLLTQHEGAAPPAFLSTHAAALIVNEHCAHARPK